MKKVMMALFLAIFLVSGHVKPAKALILDPLQLSTVVSGYLESVKEGVDKVIQQVNQIKMMVTQGFTLDGLMSMAGKYINTDKLKKALKKKMNKITENAKKKKLKEQQDKMKWDRETKLQMYEDKLNIATKDKEILENSLKDIQSGIRQKEDECTRLEREWNSETDPDKKVEKNDAYEKCKTELEDLKNNEIEQTALIKRYDKDIQAIKDKINEVKAGDADYKQMEAMLKATENTQEDSAIVDADNLADRDEWDNDESMKKFTIEEGDYQEFINKYFYDPTSIKGEGRDGMTDYQSKMDRVTRERRFLMVNTAIHLLQVVTSARREVPFREHSLEAYSNQTSESKDELEAMSAYAATRVESARALLLYAKVLSAKLQYIAARDLLNETLAKEITDPVTGQKKQYKEFDLGKYILTPEFIKYRLQQANPEQDLVDQVDIK